MIFNESNILDHDFLSTITSTFYMCTGYTLGYMSSLDMEESDHLLKTPNTQVVFSQLEEPFNRYIRENLYSILHLAASSSKKNSAILLFWDFDEVLLYCTMFHHNEFKGILYLCPFRVNDITSHYLEQLSYHHAEVNIMQINQYLDTLIILANPNL